MANATATTTTGGTEGHPVFAAYSQFSIYLSNPESDMIDGATTSNSDVELAEPVDLPGIHLKKDPMRSPSLLSTLLTAGSSGSSSSSSLPQPTSTSTPSLPPLTPAYTPIPPSVFGPSPPPILPPCPSLSIQSHTDQIISLFQSEQAQLTASYQAPLKTLEILFEKTKEGLEGRVSGLERGLETLRDMNLKESDRLKKKNGELRGKLEEVKAHFEETTKSLEGEIRELEELRDVRLKELDELKKENGELRGKLEDVKVHSKKTKEGLKGKIRALEALSKVNLKDSEGLKKENSELRGDLEDLKAHSKKTKDELERVREVKSKGLHEKEKLRAELEDLKRCLGGIGLEWVRGRGDGEIVFQDGSSISEVVKRWAGQESSAVKDLGSFFSLLLDRDPKDALQRQAQPRRQVHGIKCGTSNSLPTPPQAMRSTGTTKMQQGKAQADSSASITKDVITPSSAIRTVHYGSSTQRLIGITTPYPAELHRPSVEPAVEASIETLEAAPENLDGVSLLEELEDEERSKPASSYRRSGLRGTSQNSRWISPAVIGPSPTTAAPRLDPDPCSILAAKATTPSYRTDYRGYLTLTGITAQPPAELNHATTAVHGSSRLRTTTQYTAEPNHASTSKSALASSSSQIGTVHPIARTRTLGIRLGPGLRSRPSSRWLFPETSISNPPHEGKGTLKNLDGFEDDEGFTGDLTSRDELPIIGIPPRPTCYSSWLRAKMRSPSPDFNMYEEQEFFYQAHQPSISTSALTAGGAVAPLSLTSTSPGPAKKKKKAQLIPRKRFLSPSPTSTTAQAPEAEAGAKALPPPSKRAKVR